MSRENGKMMYDCFESPIVRGPLRGGKKFITAGNRYKTIESFCPPIGIPCYIHWNGWESRVQDLLERDWVITKVTNNFTGMVRLYVRDPVTKLMGRGELIEKKTESGLAHSWSVDMDYFCHEKNQRIKKFIQRVKGQEVFTIDENNIGAVLEHIAELQKKSAKPKKKPHYEPAEILKLKSA